MKKALKYSLLAVLVLVILGGVALVVSLDSIIRSGTEKGLGFATQCDSKLDKASLSIFSGNLKLSGLEVKNPKTFDQAHPFVAFTTSEVQLQPKSLVSDQIEIDVVNLDGLELSYIKPAEGKNNVDAILDNVNRLLPKKDPNAPEEAPKEKSPSNKAIHVGMVKFTNAKVHANVDLGAGPVKVTVPLPNFEIKDITVKGGMPELTAELIKSIGDQIIKQAPEIAKAAAASAAGSIKDLGAGAAEQGKGLLDAAKGIKNPFKK